MFTKEELQTVSKSDLIKELSKSQHEIIKIKLKLIDQSSKDSHKLHKLKKYIAQLNTVINSQHKSN